MILRQGISGHVGNHKHLIRGVFRVVYSSTSTAPPVFSGTIPNLSYNFDSGTHATDLSLYFTGATSYSISPSLESGWSFTSSVLTVDTDDVGTFGPYTVTGTNAGGDTASNAFSVTVSAVEAETYTGGFWYAFEAEQLRRRKKHKELLELEEKAEQLQNKLDRELALELRQEEKNRERIAELRRLAELAKDNEEAIEDLGERVTKAYKRAILQYNYSAMEALEREIKRAKEEEDWLISIAMELLH